MATEAGVDAHDAQGISAQSGAFVSQGDQFAAQYIDQFSDANTAGSPSLTLAEARQDSSAGLSIVSIFQTNGMSSSTGAGYQTYFTAAQGASDAAEALSSARTLDQPPGSTIYFAMDFDPAIPGAAGTEKQLLTNVQTYLTAVSQAFQGTGYTIGVYGAGDTLAAAIRNSPSSPNYNASYTPVAQYGWLTQSTGWAGSNPQTDANAAGWNIYQGNQTTQNGVAVDPDTAESTTFGQWVVCFASGTLICTARGDVAVEHLAVGDIVVTASGAHRPIRWVGHRTLDCRRHSDPRALAPVRIGKGAFAPGKPARDLLVSPGHAICLDIRGEVLMPASALVNGATIRQQLVDSITYWHVELDSHDVILAENLSCESYYELGNRGFFAEAERTELHGRPDASIAPHADFCRPFHADGLVVASAQAQLRVRARELGWTLEENRFGDLHLVVDGEIFRPDFDGQSARFVVTADATDISLISTASRPASVKDSDDTRVLGTFLAGVSIDDGLTGRREIALDHPLLDRGFHEIERDGARILRWTNGCAPLPAALWAGCRGTFFLRVDLATPALPRWVAPPAERELKTVAARVA